MKNTSFTPIHVTTWFIDNSLETDPLKIINYFDKVLSIS